MKNTRYYDESHGDYSYAAFEKLMQNVGADYVCTGLILQFTQVAWHFKSTTIMHSSPSSEPNSRDATVDIFGSSSDISAVVKMIEDKLKKTE